MSLSLIDGMYSDACPGLGRIDSEIRATEFQTAPPEGAAANGKKPAA